MTGREFARGLKRWQPPAAPARPAHLASPRQLSKTATSAHGEPAQSTKSSGPIVEELENQHFVVTVGTSPLAICRKRFNANRLVFVSLARIQ